MALTVTERLQRARDIRRSARRIQIANPPAARVLRGAARKIEMAAARTLGKRPKRR